MMTWISVCGVRGAAHLSAHTSENSKKQKHSTCLSFIEPGAYVRMLVGHVLLLCYLLLLLCKLTSYLSSFFTSMLFILNF